jgi:hypothetical protein
VVTAFIRGLIGFVYGVVAGHGVLHTPLKQYRSLTGEVNKGPIFPCYDSGRKFEEILSSRATFVHSPRIRLASPAFLDLTLKAFVPYGTAA